MPCLGIFMAYIPLFVLSPPLSGCVCYLMCCALCVMTIIFMLSSVPSAFSQVFLVVCCAPGATRHGLMCLLLICWREDIVAYRLCYVILAPLSGDPRCTCCLWVFFLLFFALGAPWNVGFLILGYLMLPSSHVCHSLDVFIACMLCSHA